VKKNKLLIALSIAACSTAVMADDETSYSFGIKNWNHTFKDKTTSSQTNASVLSATAKKGDYFVTTNFLMPATYSFGADSTWRKDSDIAVGWSVNSNVALLGGYKGVNSYSVNNGAISKSVDFKITYVGINGFTSLNQDSFLYGTFTRSLNVNKSNAASTDPKVTFTNYEAGYGYVLNKTTQLSLGYRSQTFDDTTSPKPVLSGLIFGVTLTQ